MVFFDRFYREVFGVDAPTASARCSSTQRHVVNEDWETLFDGILHDCAERLRKDPTRLPRRWSAASPST